MSEPSSQSRFDKTPVIAPGHSFGSITDKISSIVLQKETPRGWILGFGIAFLLVMGMMYAIAWLLLCGSVSATPARSSRRFSCCSSRSGAPRSTDSQRR